MEIKTNSPKETQKVAQRLTQDLVPGDVIALYGDLGAGKTVFVQGLAKGLKIKLGLQGFEPRTSGFLRIEPEAVI